jgi:hypothetical protein
MGQLFWREKKHVFGCYFGAKKGQVGQNVGRKVLKVFLE